MLNLNHTKLSQHTNIIFLFLIMRNIEKVKTFYLFKIMFLAQEKWNEIDAKYWLKNNMLHANLTRLEGKKY